VTKTLMDRSCTLFYCHRQTKPLPPRPPPRKPSSPPATIAATETIEGLCRTLLPSDLLPGRRGGADNNNDSTPSSTSTRLSSAAVAAEDDPTQRPRWRRRYHFRQRTESTINKQREVEGWGGYGETTRLGMRTCTHNNQIDHAEGEVVGDDDDDDDDDTTTTTATTTTTTITTTMADAVGGMATG
jgi:hypothetical protein